MRWTFALVVITCFGCGGPDPHADEPCTDENGTLHCPHHTLTLEGEIIGRDVHFKAPPGRDAPDGGWPVAVLFQGSFYSAGWMWTGAVGGAMGARHQTETIAQLLDAGFLVVTPETHARGTGYWDTNVLIWADNWGGAPDHGYVNQILAALEQGKFGPADMTHLYAAGISSGGYMTSRMAVSYPGRFRALAIHSASYATCAGALCNLPKRLPDDHPPTLFLHGEQDAIVPISTMRKYRDALLAEEKEAVEVVDADAHHEWLAAAPGAIVAFFLAH